MFDFRKRAFIILAGGLALLLLALFAWFLFRKSPKTVVDNVNNNVPSSVVPEPQVVLPAPTVPLAPTRPTEETTALQASRLFVERFASFSNDNNNRHIDNVLPLATKKMAAWIETQRVTQGGQYVGQTASVVSNELEKIDKENAVVKIGVQIQATVATSTNILYKNGTVNLVQSNGQWLVDGLFWVK